MNVVMYSLTHLKANQKIQYISTSCFLVTPGLFSRHKLCSVSLLLFSSIHRTGTSMLEQPVRDFVEVYITVAA